PGLRVYLPAETPIESAERMADYHAFWVERLKETLGVEGPDLIRSYVYRDREQKAELMGGRGTMVAKPWLGEIHVHGLEVPHKVVPHELVHVLAAEYGSPPFGVTAHLGVLVDMGIVEGLAEALTPSRSDYDHHYWVRALRVLDRAPDVRRLVAVTDFWRAPPARAYTVMGSFIRYLIETRGAEPVRKLYRNGDFENALGAELETVVSEWERFIDGLELSSRERRAAEERFRRRSIFQRTCAHEIAQLRTKARAAPPADSVRIYQTIAGFLGNSPDSRYEIALAELRAGNEDAFVAGATRLIDEGELNLWRATQLMEKLGRLQWDSGDLAQARQHFQAALDNPSTLDSERLQWVRLWALDLPADSRTFMRRFLSGKVDRPVAIEKLRELTGDNPDDPTYRYLLARQLLQRGDHEEAISFLAALSHPFLPIESERLRLIAAALEEEDEWRGAADAYEAVAKIMPRSGMASRLRARADWLRWLALRSAADRQ
ncbi:MAG: tetratricopeptide repeat protein, partial [Myxococcota bacterium]